MEMNEIKNPIGELMQTTMDNVKNILKVDTVVGDPIYTPDAPRRPAVSAPTAAATPPA